MSNRLPDLVRSRIASFLSPSNRMRLSLASRTWRSSSLVSNQERNRGQYIHALKNMLRRAADEVDSHWGGSYYSERLGGHGPRHGNGLRIHLFGFEDDHMMYVSYQNETIFMVSIDTLHGRVRVSMVHHGAADDEKAAVRDVFSRFGPVGYRQEAPGTY